MTRCCLIVTTHERPDALERVLAAAVAQYRLPDELIVADDGSGPATAALVKRLAATAPFPVQHAWQPHEGFRAGRIRNEAIVRTLCEYVVLLDGDMVPHPRFIADHCGLARSGHYSQGVRILLDDDATRRLLEPGGALPRPWSSGLGRLRRLYGWHAPRLAGPLRGAANALVSVKACNQGFWRDDLLAVNGFDEAVTGWGSEDKELCARLENANVRRQTLLFAAIAWHLAHPPASRAAAAVNRARWLESRRTRRTRCEAGLDRHLDA